MAITTEKLVQWSTLHDKDATEAAKTPVLLLNKYRVRLLNSDQVPIVRSFANFTALGFATKQLLFVDLPESLIKSEVVADSSMDEDDKENFKPHVDVGGNPLECSFLTLEKLMDRCEEVSCDVSWNLAEADSFDCNPIPISDALNLRNKIHNCGKLDCEELDEELRKLPVWVASAHNGMPSMCLLSCGVAKNSQSFAGITRNLGAFGKQTQLQIDQLSNVFDPKLYSHARKFRSLYRFIPRKQLSAHKNSGEVTVEVNWTGGSDVRALAEPDWSSSCLVRVNPGWLDERFLGYTASLQQLDFVLRMANVLRDPKRDLYWPNHVRMEGMLSIEKQLAAVIHSCATREKLVCVGTRTLDVTEQLWTVMYQCGSLEEATAMLEVFLRALRNNEIKAMVHSDNESRLAQLVKASMMGKFAYPRLERLNTIEMLMEIGTESCRRELIAKFKDSKFIVSQAELEEALKESESNCRTSWGEVEARALALIPVALAHVCIAQVEFLLNATSHDVVNCARKVLAQYVQVYAKSSSATKSFTFETNVPLSRFNTELLKKPSHELERRVLCIRRLRSRLQSWTCETTVTQGGNVTARMLTLLSVAPPFQHLQRDVVVADDEKNSDPASGYYASQTTMAYYCSKSNRRK